MLRFLILYCLVNIAGGGEAEKRQLIQGFKISQIQDKTMVLNSTSAMIPGKSIC